MPRRARGAAVRGAATPGTLHAVLAATLTATFATGLALVAGVAPASAHNYLVSSTPQAGETLTELPERFEIVTNDELLDVAGDGTGFELIVRDSDGLHYGDGCLEVEGRTLSSVVHLGAAGEYTVDWRVVSADGHTVSDSFGFEWQPPDDYDPATGSQQQPTCAGTGTDDGGPPAEEPAEGGPQPTESVAPGEPSDRETPADGSAEVVLALAVAGGILLLAAIVVIVTLVATRRRDAT